jgi:excisionase family DNA binding protein
MPTTDASDGALDGLPEMLTVPEAAERLRIGRTLAYQLAARFLDGQPGGIPTIRLGGTLRVPRAALEELMRVGRVATPNDLTATVADAIDDYLRDGHVTGPSEPEPGRRRRAATHGTAQLSLLGPD